MHRQTPSTAAFVGYSSGGARALIDSIDDSKMMQQMKGSMMGEGRDGVESPQNYGFSSVVRGATKGSDGAIQDCAEGFMSYFGGNRSSNFCAVMDDRRYRPMGLKEGENAQYDDLGQMTLLRRAGLFLLSLDGPDDSQQQSSGAARHRGSGDGSSSSSGQTVERDEPLCLDPPCSEAEAATSAARWWVAAAAAKRRKWCGCSNARQLQRRRSERPEPARLPARRPDRQHGGACLRWPDRILQRFNRGRLLRQAGFEVVLHWRSASRGR